jgi:cytochrome P450
LAAPRLIILPDRGAGSDTTAIALRAVVYFLCKNPDKLRKLQSEIDDAEKNGKLSEPVTYAEALSLAYLQAALKEAMRLHPSTGFTMARVVPKGGTVLLGHSLPEGVSACASLLFFSPMPLSQ